MHPDPPGRAVIDIFPWPGWGINDAIQRDKFSHYDFSHAQFPFEFYLILPDRPASAAEVPRNSQDFEDGGKQQLASSLSIAAPTVIQITCRVRAAP